MSCEDCGLDEECKCGIYETLTEFEKRIAWLEKEFVKFFDELNLLKNDNI